MCSFRILSVRSRIRLNSFNSEGDDEVFNLSARRPISNERLAFIFGLDSDFDKARVGQHSFQIVE